MGTFYFFRFETDERNSYIKRPSVTVSLVTIGVRKTVRHMRIVSIKLDVDRKLLKGLKLDDD